MTLLNPQQEKSLAAFITALEQQDESLPTGLQTQLHAIGKNIENRVTELPAIAASLPNLNKAYRSALADARTDDAEEGAVLVSTSDKDHRQELIEHATEIFTDPDPVQAAQRTLPRIFGQIASNPLKRLFGRG